MKGASMRLSRSAMGLSGVIVLSLAVLVGVGSARSTAHHATTITIATVNNPDMIVMQSLTSAFTKKYGINVKYVTLPENTLRQKVTSDVATGGGQFDIATVGLKMPLHPTWDQVAAFAAKLNNPSANRYGICLRGLPGWGEFGAPLTTVVNTFGGEWFNMKWEPQLTSPAFEAATNFYVNLIRKSGEPGATSSGFTESETAMAQGKTSIWVDATVAAGILTDPSKSKVAKDIGFAYAPTKVTPLGSHWLWAWSLGIESSSKNKDAAFKFLTWATSKAYIKPVAPKTAWAPGR